MTLAIIALVAGVLALLTTAARSRPTHGPPPRQEPAPATGPPEREGYSWIVKKDACGRVVIAIDVVDWSAPEVDGSDYARTGDGAAWGSMS